MKTSLHKAFNLGNSTLSDCSNKSPTCRGRLFRKAFTLLEILVVLAIIAVLFVLSMSMMNFINSQDSKNQAVLRKMDVLEQQLKTYRLKNGAYPSDISTNSNS